METVEKVSFFIVVLIAASVLVACSAQPGATQPGAINGPPSGPSGAAATGQAVSPSGADAGAPSTATQKVLFADTPYVNNAYLISDNATTPEEDAALAGFQVMRETQPDGSLLVTLKALQPEYQDQNYTVQPGQKLYFIERFLGDDSDGHEGNTGDDRAVLVGSDGYVVG